jgi:hypothetical protein
VVSTALAGRRPRCRDEEDDYDSSADWFDVRPPQSRSAEISITEISKAYRNGPSHTPADTPVVGKGQFEMPPHCDYPTVARKRTRTRPGR